MSNEILKLDFAEFITYPYISLIGKKVEIRGSVYTAQAAGPEETSCQRCDLRDIHNPQCVYCAFCMKFKIISVDNVAYKTRTSVIFKKGE